MDYNNLEFGTSAAVDIQNLLHVLESIPGTSDDDVIYACKLAQSLGIMSVYSTTAILREICRIAPFYQSVQWEYIVKRNLSINS